MITEDLHFPPDFYQQIKHNKLRRADWHDYYSKCFYLLTFMKNNHPEVPVFSSLFEKGNSIGVDFCWSGWAIYNSIKKFERQYPFFKMWRYVIMPDHLHLIMYATQRLDQHLGQYVRLFKTICTEQFHSKSKVRAETTASVFEAGFNDRILYQEGQLDRWTNYIEENPRRLWLMRHNPEFFRRYSLVRADCPLHILDDNANPDLEIRVPHEFPIFGNSCLLNYPEKIVVRFSSKFSHEEWEKKQKAVLQTAKNGGILVSPFIHQEEKRLMKEGINLGARIIKIIPDGYAERTKPSGNDFYHCAEGRMLFLALNPIGNDMKATAVTRPLCERMNRCAKWICGEK